MLSKLISKIPSKILKPTKEILLFLAFALPLLSRAPRLKDDNGVFWLLYGISAIIYFLSRIINFLIKGKKEEIKLKGFNKYIEIELNVLYKNMGLTNDDRICFYSKIDSKNKEDLFTLVYVKTLNRRFENFEKRTLSANEGLVSVALNKGCTVRFDLPSPNTEREKYRNLLQVELNLPTHEIDKTSLECRAYATIPISGNGSSVCGVFTIESTMPSFSHFRDVHAPEANATHSTFDEHKVSRLLQRTANRLSSFYQMHNPDKSLADIPEGY